MSCEEARPLVCVSAEPVLLQELTVSRGCVPRQGMLKGEELSSAYASADVFMMPSETETLGFVALEAMASGLPVVAVAAGGLVDIVTQPGVIGAPAPQQALRLTSSCHAKDLSPAPPVRRGLTLSAMLRCARQ